MVERWLPVVGYEGWYEVSNQGRVRRMRPSENTWVGRVLKLCPNTSGYIYVQLCRRGKVVQRAVHVVVAASWIGPRPRGAEVNHKNGIKTDCRVENLEYVTPSRNAKHAFENGLRSGDCIRGEKNHQTHLRDSDIREIRRRARAGVVQHQIAFEHQISDAAVSLIINRRTWRHVS